MSVDKEYRMPAQWKNFGKKSIVFDFIEDFLYLCIIYPAIVMILLIFNSSPITYIQPFLLLSGMIISTINRRKTKRIYIFLLLELLCFGIIVLLSGSFSTRIFFSAIMLIIIIVSIQKFLNDVKRCEITLEHNEKPDYTLYYGNALLIVGAFVLYATFIIALAYNIKNVTLLCFFAFPVLLITFEIYQHFSGALTLIGNKAGYQSDNLKRIRNINIIFAACAAATIGLLGLILNKLYYILGLDAFDRAVISMFSRRLTPSIAEPKTINSSSSTFSMQIPDGKTGNSTILYVLFVIIKVVCVIITILAIIFIILAFFIFIKNFLKIKKNNQETQSVFSVKEAIAQIKTALKRVRPHYIITGEPNNKRVRRTYFKFIRRQIKSGVEIISSQAPDEIGNKISIKKDINVVTEIYEKARYSSGECTEGDIKQIKTHTSK